MAESKIVYAVEERVTAAEFLDVLHRSTLAERRPVNEPDRIAKMVAHANLFVTARDRGKLVGVARALTDFTYCCYVSDLAVDKDYQRQGVGRALLAKTREAVGDSMVLLLSAPQSMTYYPHIGMPKAENAFIFPRRR